MLFAVLTQAKPRSVCIDDYLKTVQDGHVYVGGLIRQKKIKEAFVRAGMAAGLMILEAGSPEELDRILQGNPTAPYAEYKVIPLADPEALPLDDFIKGEGNQEIADNGSSSFSFQDSVEIKSASQVVYDHLWRVEKWPQILPHVQKIEVLEENDTFQDFNMTVSGEAGPQSNRSKRYGKPGVEIQYEQITPPPIFHVHNGVWSFEKKEDSTIVTSHHTININTDLIEDVLKRPYTLDEAKVLVRHFVGNHSIATMNVVKVLVEKK